MLICNADMHLLVTSPTESVPQPPRLLLCMQFAGCIGALVTVGANNAELVEGQSDGRIIPPM